MKGQHMLLLRVGKTTCCRGSDDLTMLRQHGVRCEHVESGGEALEFMRLYEYDLVLMDLHLPDISGIEVVRSMRATGSNVPVLILADTATAQQTTMALNQGADGFMIVPCDPQEVLARLRAIVRRRHGHANSLLRHGPTELSFDRRELRVHGRLVPTTRSEYALLELLFLKRDIVLSKAAFLDHLYCGGKEPEIKTINVMICRLRKKLTKAGVPTLIETVWGCGFILGDPQVEPMTAREEPIATPTMSLAA
jgi:two-component system, cell cycle response regulator CtrA